MSKAMPCPKFTNGKSNTFNNMVDESLSKFCLLDNSRKSVRFHIQNEFIGKHMNRWLEYIIINKFTDLFLEFGPNNYCLPRNIFSLKSVTVLHLRHCKLPRKILNKSTSLDSLQELHLTDVDSARRLTDHLRYICPAIVKLSLCGSIDILRLSCLDKLTEVGVEDTSQIDSIVVKVQSLRLFKYYCYQIGPKIPCDINVSRCRNLEVLYLDSSRKIRGFFPDICSNFPVLWELLLSFRGLSIPYKIESSVLQILVLSNIKFVVDSAIDTLNLQYLKWTNPSFFPAMTWTPLEIKIDVPMIQLLDASWFLQLRTFVQNLPSKCIKLSVSIKSSDAMVKFKHEDLRDACISSTSPHLNALNLEIDASRTMITKNDGQQLINGLLWSCHP